MVYAVVHKDGQCIVDKNDLFYRIDKNTYILNKDTSNLRVVIGCEKSRKELVVIIRMYDEEKNLVFEMQTCCVNKVMFPICLPIKEQKIFKTGKIQTFYKNDMMYTITDKDYDLINLNCVFKLSDK